MSLLMRKLPAIHERKKSEEVIRFLRVKMFIDLIILIIKQNLNYDKISISINEVFQS